MKNLLVLISLVGIVKSFYINGTDSNLSSSINKIKILENFEEINNKKHIIDGNKDESKYNKRYLMGYRITGDHLERYGSNSYVYSEPQNVELVLTYPEFGIGKTVTYVEVNVLQSSDIGNIKVLSGGIGHRSIILVITAQTTTVFEYEASIYTREMY